MPRALSYASLRLHSIESIWHYNERKVMRSRSQSASWYLLSFLHRVCRQPQDVLDFPRRSQQRYQSPCNRSRWRWIPRAVPFNFQLPDYDNRGDHYTCKCNSEKNRVPPPGPFDSAIEAIESVSVAITVGISYPLQKKDRRLPTFTRCNIHFLGVALNKVFSE